MEDPSFLLLLLQPRCPMHSTAGTHLYASHLSWMRRNFYATLTSLRLVPTYRNLSFIALEGEIAVFSESYLLLISSLKNLVSFEVMPQLTWWSWVPTVQQVSNCTTCFYAKLRKLNVTCTFISVSFFKVIGQF